MAAATAPSRPRLEYGGTVGQTQYFVSGRYFGSNLGIENPTPAYNAIHDHTSQEKGFLYLSTVLDPSSRLTFMSGVSNGSYQIPNNPGQPPVYTAFGVSNFNSALLNERQSEFNQFNVLAYQKSGDGIDYQLSYFNRYSQLHFLPDTIGDLVFNGVASDVYRQSVINGIQEDTSYRVGFAHTLKFGFSASAERSLVNNGSTVLPLDPMGNPVDAPFSVFDSSAKTGVLFSTYLADEWKVTNNLTVNAGLRFDQMWQYVDANQLSPRLSMTWKPTDGTTFHAGYARNFTPPEQVLAAPTNLALVQNTTAQAPPGSANDPVLPERSNVFDVGVVQKIYAIPGLEVGLDAYYKTATDLLDDGQFGQAYVLTAFNYARGINEGVELKASYTNGNLHLYGNLAWARQIATDVVSNQYLFDPAELNYIANNYVYTDHAQFLTASAGASYLWQGTKFSASMIYGSGLRDGFANTGTVPSYTQVNLGVSHDFNIVSPTKPTTLRFDIVNLFDTIYQIRDGSGIGVFAPQYGPRLGFFSAFRRSCEHGPLVRDAAARLLTMRVGPHPEEPRLRGVSKDGSHGRNAVGSRSACKTPVRADRAGNAGEGALDEFCHQQTVVIDRSGHDRPALRNRLEADAAVIGFVAHQQHQPMAACLGILQRAIEQSPANAAAAKRRLDRQGSKQQRPGLADTDRQLAHRAHQQRSDPGREGQFEQMIDMLADPVSAQHEAAGPERARVQPLDRLRVVGGFGQNRQ